MGLRWSCVGVEAGSSQYFQGCNLLKDEPSWSFKRWDEIYKGNQTPLPAQHLSKYFSLNLLSRLIKSAASFYFHLIHYV